MNAINNTPYLAIYYACVEDKQDFEIFLLNVTNNTM